MRIISPFKDYYDCVQGMGQDLETLYIRKSEEIELSVFPFPVLKAWGWGNNPVLIRTHIIGFCGKIYPTLEITTGDRLSTIESKPCDTLFCYNIEEVDSIIESNFKKKQVESYHWKQKSKRKNKWYGSRRYWPKEYIRVTIEKFFTKCENKKEDYKHLFIKHNCPIFVASFRFRQKSVITYNGKLEPLEFMRVFDPYSAFQELYSYIGGLAKPLKEIPKISDVDMRDAKGFDKWSFKKEPTKKKK